MSKFTDRDLKKTYSSFNRKYFDNKLPKSMVVRFGRLSYQDYGEYDPDGIITISSSISHIAEMIMTTLLHEMAHVAVGPQAEHGMIWQSKIVELFNQGAYDGLL